MTQQQEEELIAKSGGGSNIPTHPDGQYAATCIDIIDKGMVENKKYNKQQHRFVMRFFCGEWAKDGHPEDQPEERLGGYRIDGKGVREIPLWVDVWMTLSLSAKAELTKFLAAWRGQAFTEEELKGFNVVKLLHVNAVLQLSHNVVGDKTYVNVDSIMKLSKQMAAAMPAPGVPDNYVRVRDRPKDDGKVNHGDAGPGSEEEDDEDRLPF